MARLVYACRFDVAASNAIDSVLSAYKTWIVWHYRHRRKLTEFTFDPETLGVHDVPEHHALTSSMYQDGDERVVCIHWSYPDNNDAGLLWANEIRVGQFGARCALEHLISIQSIEYNLSPTKLKLGSPRVIRDICLNTLTYVGEMQIKAEAYVLKQDKLNELMSLLTSNLRKLPVILLSPYARGRPNLINHAELAQTLAGVAVVVPVDDPDLTWDFADEVGRQLSCFNGAARIYWPGFSNGSDPRSHHLYLGALIQQVGPDTTVQAIEREIFAVATFRYVPDGRITELVRRIEAVQRRQSLIERMQAGDEFLEEYERDLARLDEAETRIRELEAENVNLRTNQELFFSIANRSPIELAQAEEAEHFRSVLEAVLAAEKRCENLVFLEAAESAARESSFQRPSEIYGALSDLNEIVKAWNSNYKEKGSGGDLLQHLRERGWGKRSSMHISSTTRTKYRSHYEFDYQGRRQLFEPHITIGAGDANSCASIHFIFDQQQSKMIIAHVGRHLPNTKT